MEPLEKSAIEKAKACVRKGLGYTNQAIAIDISDGYPWEIKGKLLAEASRLAGLEGESNAESLVSR
jgi:hypothetical protein